MGSPAELKETLAAACGTRAVVVKRGEIFLVEHVRIHLDEVDGLGDFLEFEAVLGPTVSAAEGKIQVNALARRSASKRSN